MTGPNQHRRVPTTSLTAEQEQRDRLVPKGKSVPERCACGLCIWVNPDLPEEQLVVVRYGHHTPTRCRTQDGQIVPAEEVR